MKKNTNDDHALVGTVIADYSQQLYLLFIGTVSNPR
jgi:hypothetical protein